MAAAGDPSFRGFWKPRLSDELTEREREVLALVAERHSNDGICKKLFLSPKAVETLVRHTRLTWNRRGAD